MKMFKNERMNTFFTRKRVRQATDLIADLATLGGIIYTLWMATADKPKSKPNTKSK